MEEENSLRQKLELLKRDLARKQKKIEKLDRSKAAKEHVKKKIKEQQTKAEDDVKDIFTPLSAHRGQMEKIQATCKIKTTHVSFNLAKNETTKKQTPEPNTHSSNVKVFPKSDPSELLISTVPCSQDDFKATPLLNIQENRKLVKIDKPAVTEGIELGRRISKKRRSLPANVNISSAPSSHSNPAVHGKSTEINVHKELSNACGSTLVTESNIDAASFREGHLGLNDIKKNPTTTDLSSPSSLGQPLVLDKPANLSCVQESEISSSSFITPVISRSRPARGNATPTDLKTMNCSTEEKAITKHKKSPESDMSRLGVKERSKARRSATNLDFSFLDEECSGDMYSQIKTRRRRSNCSSQASQAALFALSQEEEDPSYEGPWKKQLMPKIGHGLSQKQTPPNSKSHQIKESALSVPNVRRSDKSSPLINSWPMQCDIGSESPLSSPVHSSLPQSKSSRRSSRKLKMRLPEAGIFEEVRDFTLPASEYGQQIQQRLLRVTDPTDQDSQLVNCTLENSLRLQLSSQGKRSPKVSGKLIQLPPKGICESVSHFSLPDTDYAELKLIKISSYVKENDIICDTPNSGKAQISNTDTISTLVKSQETKTDNLEENQKMESQRAMRKVSSTSKRRRSRKLSPILKVTDDDATSLFSSQEPLIYNENPANSELNDAMISDFPPQEEFIQRKLSRATRNSQSSSGRSRKKRTVKYQSPEIKSQDSRPSVTGTCSATERAYVENDVVAAIGKSESQNEDMLNIGLLNDSVSYTSTSQASSEPDELGPNGLRKIDCVELQDNRLDIQSIDAISGYIGSERATIVALAGPKWVQLWCQKERQPWDFVHEWGISKQAVESVQILTTGDIVAVMVSSTTCIRVFVYASSGRAWNFVVCNRNSQKLFSCKSSMSLLLAEVTQCSSTVIKYEMREDWKCCDSGTDIGDINDCLVSLTTIRGQNGAVTGATATHAYIWNHNRAALLVKIPFPVNACTCLTSIAEHGLIFMWVSVVGELPCLLVANPNTARCVIAGSLEPSLESDTGLSYMCADTECLVAVSLDSNISTWDAVSGALRTKVELMESPSCLTLVQNAPSRSVIVTNTGWLQAYNLSTSDNSHM